MSGVLPLGPGVQVLDLESVDPTIVSIAHSGRVQARKLVGQKWKVTVRWPRLKRTEFRAIFAFLAAQRGQFETFSVTPPVITTPSGVATGTPLVRNRQNFFPNSDAIDLWSLSNVTVTPNAIAAPDGTMTADGITDSNTGAVGRVLNTVSIPTTNLPYTTSVYLKKGTSDLITVWLELNGGTYQANTAWFNFLTGQLSTGSGANTRADDVGSGWFRISVMQQNTLLNTVAVISIHPAPGAVSGTYNSSSTGSVYAWRGQIEQATAVGPNVSTTAATVTSENQSGTSLITDGWTPSVTGILKAGDLFKIAGNNKVYMLAADASSDAGGVATLSLTHPLVATPADNAGLTVNAASFTMRLLSDSIRYRYSGALVDLEADFIEDLA